MNKKNVICRPCKEQNNWEIEEPNGKVSKTHYNTRAACVKAGKSMSQEFGCELVVENQSTISAANKAAGASASASKANASKTTANKTTANKTTASKTTRASKTNNNY